jgi:hypothetical protein
MQLQLENDHFNQPCQTTKPVTIHIGVTGTAAAAAVQLAVGSKAPSACNTHYRLQDNATDFH